MTREERAWRSLCGGKPAPKAQPRPSRPPATDPWITHPERLTDPWWQMRRYRKGGKLAFLRAYGLLDQAKLDAHYALVESQARASTTAS